ncbi:peptidylprolyl isomerase [Methanosarcina sp. Z-7115]|uniref:Peptidyl-prolyl cis-trans isomerase n=1 Tax=Methanosarcina baikalica TaxID=3073890 RepID=A0ABU2CYL9_9EURY|nr:peptidylprolyl isomerase [Methanosarcina sp. Z-7115]MDR7664793.1 peptidylprolyl isomerase [Methanosarcina sp. Z-7115]
MKRMKVRNGAILFISILLLGSILLGSGCTDKGNVNETGDSRIVKTGDTVQVDYTGKLENGTVFDTSIEEVAKQAGTYDSNRTYTPLTFVAGTGQMIKGFDEGVIGMKVGEEKTITIPPEEAYGEYDKSKILAIPIKELNLTETPEVGQTLRDMYGNPFKVIAVNDTHVTLDLNRELAGKTLVFDIKLVSIE